MTPKHTIYLETMGCQMNVLDSELVIGEMVARGYHPTEDMFSADLVVLNTCSVRQHAEDKVWSRLGQLRRTRKRRPDQLIAVIGCMAERNGDALLERAPHVDVLCGPSELNRLPALIDDVLETRRKAVALTGRWRDRSTAVSHRPRHDDLEALDSSRAVLGNSAVAPPVFAAPFQAYVRITRGCNKFCAFCVVPMTRGLEVHRPPDQIVSEVRRLCETGVREVTLLGQTVNHYRYEETGCVTSFATLLRRVHDEVPLLPRLRFVTSFPRDFTDEALRVMAESPRICRYLHVPAQSGSNRVLRAMNRGYTVEQYKALLDRARRLMPDLCIAGDMIVGFPGETENDFAASIDLLRYAKYKNCFIFKYSPRPGTAAFDRLPDDVADDVKRRRNNDLLAVQAEINLANHREWIGRTAQVLVEGLSKAALKRQESEQSRGQEVADASDSARGPTAPRGKEPSVQLVGRTSGDQIVVFDGHLSWIGRILPVEVLAVTPYTLHGRAPADVAAAPDTAPARTGQLSLPVLANG